MTLTIHPTTKTVIVNGVPARIWEGTSDQGVGVSLLVTRVAVSADESPERLKAFEDSLVEKRPPSVAVEAWPLSMIL